MNTELNAFLALLQGRPEDFRNILLEDNQYDRRENDWSVIEARIREATENIRILAVQEAIRNIYREILGLFPARDFSAGLKEECADAFFEGVSAVEDVLDRALKLYQAKEKQLGPPSSE